MGEIRPKTCQGVGITWHSPSLPHSKPTPNESDANVSATTHTTHKDTGVEVFEFANGQVERKTADGRREVHFPDEPASA